MDVDTNSCQLFFDAGPKCISSRGTFLENIIFFSSILKRNIGENPTFIVSSCGGYRAKSARWGSKNSSDSDELDLDTGSFVIIFSKKIMLAEKSLLMNLHSGYHMYIIVYGQMHHCGHIHIIHFFTYSSCIHTCVSSTNGVFVRRRL